jgi:hypothetical protein
VTACNKRAGVRQAGTGGSWQVITTTANNPDGEDEYTDVTSYVEEPSPGTAVRQSDTAVVPEPVIVPGGSEG